MGLMLTNCEMSSNSDQPTLNMNLIVSSWDSKITKSDVLNLITNSLIKFSCYLNGLIGAKTDVNYRILQPIVTPNYIDKTFTVTIKFDIQLNELKPKELHKVILQKSKIIKEFLEDYDWTTTQDDVKRWIRVLQTSVDKKLILFSVQLELSEDIL